MYLDKNIFVLLVIIESLGLQIRASGGKQQFLLNL